MYRLGERIDKQAEELAHIESLDNGKPVFMSKVRRWLCIAVSIGNIIMHCALAAIQCS